MISLLLYTSISAGPSYSSSVFISLPHLLRSHTIDLLSAEADTNTLTENGDHSTLNTFI